MFLFPLLLDNLESSILKEVIDDICYLGAKKLCLSGGEPFLHKDILRIIEYATNKGLEINIYSSGIVGTSDNKESYFSFIAWHDAVILFSGDESGSPILIFSPLFLISYNFFLHKHMM